MNGLFCVMNAILILMKVGIGVVGSAARGDGPVGRQTQLGEEKLRMSVLVWLVCFNVVAVLRNFVFSFI